MRCALANEDMFRVAQNAGVDTKHKNGLKAPQCCCNKNAVSNPGDQDCRLDFETLVLTPIQRWLSFGRFVSAELAGRECSRHKIP